MENKDSNVLYYIDKGIERLQENSRFPPESIIDTSKSFYIPCILRKVPEQIYNRRVNDICYGVLVHDLAP